MTEYDYRIYKLKNLFLNYSDKKIALYGTGDSVNMIISEFPDIDFVGLMDAKKEGEFHRGYYIMSEGDALLMGVEVLLIPARFDSAIAVYKRVFAFCFSHNIRVLDIFGNDMTQVYGEVLKHLCYYSELKNNDFVRLLNSYDTISISMRDALSYEEGFDIIPRIWMLGILKNTIESGKRIIIISDYDHTEAECRSLLSKWGIEGDYSCIVEKEDGLSIYDGLFCEICELSKGKLLHIGCDFVRDGYVPKAYGQDSFIIKKSTELFGDPFYSEDESQRKYPSITRRLKNISQEIAHVCSKNNRESGNKNDIHKNILVIFSHIPQYDKYGGDRTAYCYLKLFVKMGLEVTFIPADFESIPDYEDDLEKLGINTLIGDFYRKHWLEWMAAYGDRFDFVFSQLPMETLRFCKAVRTYCTNAKLFYCEHELSFLRKEREFSITGREGLKREAAYYKDLQFGLINEADAVYELSDYEKEILSEAFPDKTIKCIPVYLYDELPNIVKRNFSERTGILIVAHIDFEQNLDGIIWFKESIFPHIIARYPDLIWHIVGKVSEENRKKIEGNNIVVHGWIPEEELNELYMTCRIEVVPLRFGTGVKGKIIEAAYHGLPVVTTPIGAEGIPLDEGNIIVSEGTKGIVATIIALYEDYKKLKLMSASAIEFIKNHYLYDVAENIFQKDFNLNCKESNEC